MRRGYGLESLTKIFVYNCATTLKALVERNMVVLHCVTGHSDIKGYDTSDELAKAGARDVSSPSEGTAGVKGVGGRSAAAVGTGSCLPRRKASPSLHRYGASPPHCSTHLVRFMGCGRCGVRHRTLAGESCWLQGNGVHSYKALINARFILRLWH